MVKMYLQLNQILAAALLLGAAASAGERAAAAARAARARPARLDFVGPELEVAGVRDLHDHPLPDHIMADDLPFPTRRGDGGADGGKAGLRLPVVVVFVPEAAHQL